MEILLIPSSAKCLTTIIFASTLLGIVHEYALYFLTGTKYPIV